MAGDRRDPARLLPRVRIHRASHPDDAARAPPFELVSESMNVDDGAVGLTGCVTQRHVDHRGVPDGAQRLGHQIGQRGEPSPVTGSQQHRRQVRLCPRAIRPATGRRAGRSFCVRRHAVAKVLRVRVSTLEYSDRPTDSLSAERSTRRHGRASAALSHVVASVRNAVVTALPGSLISGHRPRAAADLSAACGSFTHRRASAASPSARWPSTSGVRPMPCRARTRGPDRAARRRR